MKGNVFSAIVAVIVEGCLIGVFINEAIKLFNNDANASATILILSVIGIVGIVSLAISLFK